MSTDPTRDLLASMASHHLRDVLVGNTPAGPMETEDAGLGSVLEDASSAEGSPPYVRRRLAPRERALFDHMVNTNSSDDGVSSWQRPSTLCPVLVDAGVGRGEEEKETECKQEGKAKGTPEAPGEHSSSRA